MACSFVRSCVETDFTQLPMPHTRLLLTLKQTRGLLYTANMFLYTPSNARLHCLGLLGNGHPDGHHSNHSTRHHHTHQYKTRCTVRNFSRLQRCSHVAFPSIRYRRQRAPRGMRALTQHPARFMISTSPFPPANLRFEYGIEKGKVTNHVQ